MASLAGTWIALVAGFGGMRDHDGQLSFAPQLPEQLTGLSFGILHRGRRLHVDIAADEVTYTLTDGESTLTVLHHGDPVDVAADKPVTLSLAAVKPRARPAQPKGREPQRRHPDVAR
jgi:alpha,alpha-trehalose phosphorylase